MKCGIIIQVPMTVSPDLSLVLRSAALVMLHLPHRILVADPWAGLSRPRQAFIEDFDLLDTDFSRDSCAMVKITAPVWLLTDAAPGSVGHLDS
jgi:hypothetical protein